MESRRYDILYKHEANHWWFKGRRKLLEAIIKDLPQKPPLKILDSGCCTGYNLYLLSKYGKVYGVDTERKAVAYCKKRGFSRTRLLKNGLKIPFKDNYFDIVTSLDVIEHVTKDKEYLKELYRILAPGGHLILFTPAIKLLWSHLDIKSHHIRRYDKKMLASKVKGTQFAIKEIKYFNYLMFSPILLIRLLQKLPMFKEKDWGSELIVYNRFINKIQTLIFYLDVWSVKWLSPPIGVSLLVVGKK